MLFVGETVYERAAEGLEEAEGRLQGCEAVAGGSGFHEVTTFWARRQLSWPCTLPPHPHRVPTRCKTHLNITWAVLVLPCKQRLSHLTGRLLSTQRTVDAAPVMYHALAALGMVHTVCMQGLLASHTTWMLPVGAGAPTGRAPASHGGA